MQGLLYVAVSRLKKLSKIKDFREWLTEVKQVDDLSRSERADFEALTKTTHNNSRHNNALAEPSCCANINGQSAGTSSSSNGCVVLPKLLDTKHQLLYDNEGCLKCHRVFISHCLKKCPNDFPEPMKYKTLTQGFVENDQAVLEEADHRCALKHRV